MTPGDIDRAQTLWAKRLDAALVDTVRRYRSDMLAAGKPAAEIDAEIAAYMPELESFRRARRKDIRSLIVGARYGLLGVQH